MIDIRPYLESDFSEVFDLIKKKFDLAKLNNLNLPIPSFLSEARLKKRLPNDMLVAIKKNVVVGFLGGFFIDEINTHKGGFLTPIALHGVKEGENKRLILYKLVQSMSRICVKKATYNLALILHAYDIETKSIMFDLGYGALTYDFIRGVDFIKTAPLDKSLSIKRAEMSDLTSLMPLFLGIHNHLIDAPIFLNDHDFYQSMQRYYETQIKDPSNGIFMVLLDHRPIAYIKFTTKSINRQELDGGKTIGVNGAFVLPMHRGKDLMEHLLNQVITYANCHDFTHIMTDCESANFEALDFWKKHFTIYSIAVMRHINHDISQ